METLRGSPILPRRLTKLFADTKKSYENVIQTKHEEGPELSSLHRELRTQKDRLLAWGLGWSDQAQTGDIDGSLDRAGVSDLVASLMSSIRKLFDEAAELQSPKNIDRSLSYCDIKAPGKSAPASLSPADSSNRLKQILKDLIASIDTLCDISQPRVEGWEKKATHLVNFGVDSNRTPSFVDPADLTADDLPPAKVDIQGEQTPMSRHGDSIVYTQIAPSCIIQKQAIYSGSAPLPPSYEFVAAGFEHRILACLMQSQECAKTGEIPSPNSREVPVLLDYGLPFAYEAPVILREGAVRYEELYLKLRQLAFDANGAYSGILPLRGWSLDPDKSRCAFVYDVPTGQDSPSPAMQHRSLLSFLQNGADADGANMPDLENRYRLAFNIASSLKRLHASGLSHGSVNSNNVVFFVDSNETTVKEKPWKGPVLRKSYLTGYRQSAPKAPKPGRETSFDDIYHHPNVGNGGIYPYTSAHDYYSLGLILLEIGLWMPIGKFWKPKYTRADFKHRLQNIYLRKLSAKCGSQYMRAALYCMEAADDALKGADSTGHQALETFMSTVLKPLERCCMIEDDQDEVPATGSTLRSPKQSDPPMSTSSTVSPPSSTQRDNDGERSEHQLLSTIPEPVVNGLKQGESGPKQMVRPERKIRRPPASKGKIKVWSHELPSLYTKYWTSTMCPRLERILSKAISRWESYTIDLFMAGKEADSARPTIYLECTSTAKVRKILRHLNKDLRLFDIQVVSGSIVRSAGKKKRKNAQKCISKSSPGRDKADVSMDLQRLNPYYQQIPSCGSSIGACSNGKHLPPVTFGGAVLVNGETYGMSVHHMLEDDDELELGLGEKLDLQRSMAPVQSCFRFDRLRVHESTDLQDLSRGLSSVDNGSNGEANGDDDKDLEDECEKSECSDNGEPHYTFSPQALYPFEISEDEEDLEESLADEDDFWLSADIESQSQISNGDADSDDDVELGDTPGIDAGCGKHLAVTQPAIDDVHREFFSTFEGMDEEHLSAHHLGHVHASSGIKRSRQNDIIHEVDWALIKVNESRMQPRNIVQGGGRYCKLTNAAAEAATTPIQGRQKPSAIDSYPCNVTSSKELGGLQVHAFGRTSGLQTGIILPAMRMVRMPEGGDSGAWVIDNSTGHVCGHVLAYSSKSNVAYIAPMEVLLKDMAKTLSAEISLPLPHASPDVYDHIDNRSASQQEKEMVGIQLEGGIGAEDNLAEVSRPTPEPPSSPPLPTSPPILIHELSRLNLKDMTESNSPLDRTLPDRVDAAATCRSKGRTTGELGECAGRVRAKC
ncbi:MAG: hypothetical protein Q9187_003208 [Circinaria calcarea]